MHRAGEDFELSVPDAQPGDTYSFLFDDGRLRPDPVSRSQPYGVHGPSQVVYPDAFVWSDQDWKGIALSDYILYELHVGTFTPEGTFASAISKLSHLQDLGITAIELMPVGEFPGTRNWGYDQVDLYAPHSAYGGSDGLKSSGGRLPSSRHRRGPGCYLQPRWSRRQLPRGIWALFHRSIPHAVGPRHEFRWARQRWRSPLRHRERALLAHRVSHRRASIGRHPRDLRLQRAPYSV